MKNPANEYISDTAFEVPSHPEAVPALAGLQMDNSAPDGRGDRMGTIIGTQFAEDVPQMNFDRFLCDKQLLRDIPVPVAGGYMAQNLDFAFTQGFFTDM